MDNNNFTSLFNKRLFLHITFWATYILFLVIRIVEREGPDMEGDTNQIIAKESIRLVVLMTAIYINLRIFIPHFFNKNKYWNFVLSNLALIFISSLTTVWGTNFLDIVSQKGTNIHIRMLWTCIHKTMFITITSLLHFTREWIKLKDINLNIKELQNEKLEVELESLKGQLNPHFLFNTLNNLYSLSLVKSDYAPNMILKLSDLMSYIIYDTKSNFITLNKEIEFSENYISLEELRLKEHLNLNVDIKCKDSDRMIAPLLFMPFIENAFKYTPKGSEKSFIKINIEAHLNEPIRFTIENTKDVEALENKDESRSGLGIKNVRKRLNLLYPKKHKLDILDKDKLFIVKLQISN